MDRKLFYRPEAGPKSIGIGLCRFVGTAPGILGSASSGLGADSGPKSTILGRILKSFLGPCSSAEDALGRAVGALSRYDGGDDGGRGGHDDGLAETGARPLWARRVVWAGPVLWPLLGLGT